MYTCRHPRQQPSLRRRLAFTMLELLVVMGLIAFLMGALAYSLGNVLGNAKERATQATILKIGLLIEQRVEAFNREMDKLERSGQADQLAAFLGDILNNNGFRGIGGTAASQNNSTLKGLRRFLLRKVMYRRAFPQSLSTYPGFTVSLPGPTYTPYAKQFGLTSNWHKLTGQTVSTIEGLESAELLYFTLIEDAAFGSPVGEAGDFTAAETADLDGDGHREFVDAWGRPIRFWLWPTNLFFPTNTNIPDVELASLLVNDVQRLQLNQDPDDQNATFSKTVLQDAAMRTTFEQWFHKPNVFHVPLVVSAGPDGKTGLLDPIDRTTAFRRGMNAQPELDTTVAANRATLIDRLSDDITNLNIRSR